MRISEKTDTLQHGDLAHLRHRGEPAGELSDHLVLERAQLGEVELRLAERDAVVGEPCETLSPGLILSSFTTPAPGEGISIVALSDSSVMRDCSFATASPGLTRTSMTSTFLKSPMSGTFTSIPGI